ncbi:E3 ubiquitin-protein ligase NEURL1B isoform X2 [Latimeria chalumnae]|uniref:E3 ubiquitin-protein ligase NEURL1B isoform X2 n=1 Tax=Latimeria chalumnae TaxID=7897 RepID=UPI0003C146D0|nr:PREDICTED: E3 ubiquitin-protein ligase NEURL1B isoform X2 [Latimeria chalumnae]|eukprot:XP_005992563.1 PREDICTED: E3 ubiquitin-protein ligase NEURL1B isoform X2 [Latimeria chalumnae]
MGNTPHKTIRDKSKQTRSMPIRSYYTLPNSGHERRSHLAITEPPRFHSQAKGKNIRLDAHFRKATRKNSFCNGITFTNRPIHLYEKVRLKLSVVHHGWSGALRFGFSTHDPSKMSSDDIPKYACPDLVTRPGFWAKALPERFALRDSVLAFWVDRHGQVFYSVNDEDPILFHCGVKVSGPLWALIDVYGITQEVQLLDSMFAETMIPAARLSTCLPQTNHDSANFSNNELENNQVVTKITNLNLGRVSGLSINNHMIPCCPDRRQRSQGLPAILETDLHFHQTRGPDVTLSQDRTAAYTKWEESNRTLVFSDRPLRIGETLFVEVGHLGLTYYGALLFGITSCDPGTLQINDLPADPESLLDRKEYWVVYRGIQVLNSGDVMSFTVMPNGEVHHGVNGNNRGMVMCVDTSQSLWVFFSIHGAVNQLKILGATYTSFRNGSPSGSPSGSQYDSDSDLAFSVNRSSSASESSLVTAPSSPLNPPLSPLFLPPEPQSNKNGECTVCFDSEVDTVIYTCGHMCLCNSCGLKLKKQSNACCPICRRVIKDVIKIYRS